MLHITNKMTNHIFVLFIPFSHFVSISHTKIQNYFETRIHFLKKSINTRNLTTLQSYNLTQYASLRSNGSLIIIYIIIYIIISIS